MSERISGQPIDWCWIPIDRKTLASLSRKSNLLGALQTLGFLASLGCTGSAAYYSGGHWPWYLTIVLLFLHGTCWAIAFINPVGFLRTLRMTLRHAFGRIEGDWEERLFPHHKVEQRRQLSRWACLLLTGHGTLVAGALYFHLWMLPVVVTVAPFYGRAIQWLCNESQHTGLPGNVPDFRLCSRTIYLNPLLQFLYWHMNYHTDHHFFAAVPCYRLGRLHRAIKDSLPPCPRGLLATWRRIGATIERQKLEPGYQCFAPLPAE